MSSVASKLCELRQFLYLPERQILFGLIEHYVPFFPKLTKKEKLEMILKGVYINDDTFLTTNTIIMKATQNFILSTKRFELCVGLVI